MNVADLIPTGRRTSKGAGETPAAETPDAVPEAARKSSGEGSFADILAGGAELPVSVVPVAEATADVPPETNTGAEPEISDGVAVVVTSEVLPAEDAIVADEAGAVGMEDIPVPENAVVTVPPPDAFRPRAQPDDARRAAAPAQVAATPPTTSARDVVPPVEADAAMAGNEVVAALTTSAAPTGGGTPSTAPAPASAAPATAAPTPAATILVAASDSAAMGWRLEADAPPAAVRAEVQATPGAPQPVGRQIAAAVAQASSGMVEIRLDPSELGRVQIRLEPGEDGLRAVVLAERPETQDLLRRNADQLARDLTEAGYARVSLDFAAGGQSARRDERPAAGFAMAATAPIDATASAAIPHSRNLSAAGGLDIRL